MAEMFIVNTDVPEKHSSLIEGEVASHKLNPAHPIADRIDALKKEKKALAAKLEGTNPLGEEAAKELRAAIKDEADKIQTVLHSEAEKLAGQRAHLDTELAKNLKAAKDPAAVKAIQKAHATEIEELSKLEKAVAGQREVVVAGTEAKHIGGAADAVVKEAGTAVEAGAKAGTKFLGQTAAKELGAGAYTAATWEKAGRWEKLKASAKANWNVSSIEKNGAIKEASWFGKKGMRVIGTGAGVIIGGYGLKDIGQYAGVVGADVDDAGKEIPSDAGKLFKGLAELGAGAGLVYWSVLRGGAAKAQGMHSL